jgi:hypothetical protein
MGSPVRHPLRVVTALVMLATLAGCNQHTESSDADSVDQFVQAAIDRQWSQFHSSFPGYDRPDVPIISYISPQDWGTTMLSCLQDAGFDDATLDADGSIGMEGATAQEGQFHLALYVCEASHPYGRKYVTPFTSAQIDYLYSYYVDTLTPCLEQHGINVSAPPSPSVFRESFGADSWYPYAAVNQQALEPGDWSALNAACPSDPDDAIYGLGD